jgi:hypothetical protein
MGCMGLIELPSIRVVQSRRTPHELTVLARVSFESLPRQLIHAATRAHVQPSRIAHCSPTRLLITSDAFWCVSRSND